MRLLRLTRTRCTRSTVMIGALLIIAIGLFIRIQAREGSITHTFLSDVHYKVFGSSINSEFELLKAVERKKSVMRKAGEKLDSFKAPQEAKMEQQKPLHCNVYEPMRIDEKFVQTNLRTAKGLLPIFVHDMNDELSRSLMRTNAWEPETVTFVVYSLQNDGNMHLIDLGANLGVYTIAAAAVNRRVVAVEPNLINAKRLRKSVLENNMGGLVTIVLNAVSDRHETVRIAAPQANIGGGKAIRLTGERYPFFAQSDSPKSEDQPATQTSFVDDVHKQVVAHDEAGTVNFGDAVFTVTLDDLLEVTTFDRAIMKIDIEGSEAAALRGADALFQQIDIPVVLFEWAERSEEDAAAIRKFFYDRGYAAYSNPYSDAPLLDRLMWPWDIVWKRNPGFKPKNSPELATSAPDAAKSKSKSKSKVKTVHCNVYDSEVRDNFPLTVLHTALGECGIFTYDESDAISRTLMTTGIWEPNQISHLLYVFGADPQLHLIDIGCNLGVYSLVAAMQHRQVVAVDANVANLRRLRKSVWLNRFEERVTLVWNAVTDRRGDTMKVILVNRNIGGSFVVPRNVTVDGIQPRKDADKDVDVALTEQSTEVETIVMDDLLEVITFDRAVLKLDIEGDEVRALRGAAGLFEKIDIPIVYFEWGVTYDDADADSDAEDDSGKTKTKTGGVGRSAEDRKWILRFFADRGYSPFADPRKAEPLREDSDTPWPFDIVFMRKKSAWAKQPASTTPSSNVKRDRKSDRRRTAAPTDAKVKKPAKKTQEEVELQLQSSDESMVSWETQVQQRVRPKKLWNLTVLPLVNVNLTVEERFLFRPLTLKLPDELGSVRVYGYFEPDLISNSLAAVSEWESAQLHAVVNVLRASRNLHFIDIGCNIGTYTLAAAKIGRQVLAVDANEASLLRVRVAAIEQGFDRLVTLVLNAVSDSYKRMILVREQGNVGGNRVWPLSPFYNVTKRDALTRSVLMDDLVEPLRAAGIRKAMLKMDIEGHEVQALRFAERLFEAVRIPVVFIEWGKIAMLSSGSESEVRLFMRKHSYQPYAYYDATIPLPADTSQWPWNVVWKKNDSLSLVIVNRN